MTAVLLRSGDRHAHREELCEVVDWVYQRLLANHKRTSKGTNSTTLISDFWLLDL